MDRYIGAVFNNQTLLVVAPAQGRSLECLLTDRYLPGSVASRMGR